MQEVRFIHAADIHLDSPFIGLKRLPSQHFEKIKESTFQAFKHVISYAIKEQVDFVLLCGDIYDGEHRSLKAQLFLKEQLEKLVAHNIQAYIIHGNHDHLGGSRIQLEWPKGVHFFGPEVEMLPFSQNDKTIAHLYGFSYGSKAISENMALHYNKSGDALFHIGLLHGSEGNHDSNHDPYAPFSVNDLLSKKFSYWALGHIHKRKEIHREPAIVYPGNTQGRHAKESGKKGCYLVRLTMNSENLTFLPTSEVIWLDEIIEIDGLTSIDQLITVIGKKKNLIRDSYKESNLLRIRVCGHGRLYSLLQEDSVLEEVMELLNKEEEQEDQFVWIASIKNETSPQWDRIQLKGEQHFIGEVINKIDSYAGFEDAEAPILQHPIGKKILRSFSEEEKKEILLEVEKLLLSDLLK